jgi:NAD(P) transhydrogenase
MAMTPARSSPSEQTVMASRDINTLRYFISRTFNYPTLPEAFRIAAYNGLNRLT